MEISSQWTQIDGGDIQIDAFVAAPKRSQPAPGIVVLQEIFGVNSHIRDVTQRLAREGYFAIAPAIFFRQAAGFEAGYSESEVTTGRKYKEQTTAAELMGDIQGAVKHLSNLPNCLPSFGCIGFCFGGHVAYLAATLPEIRATASFYGAGIARLTPGGGPPTLSRTQEIEGTLYGFFGTEDSLIPNDQVDEIEQALVSNKVDHKVFRYPCGHGFLCDQRDSYHEPSAKKAWNEVLELFHAKLNG